MTDKRLTRTGGYHTDGGFNNTEKAIILGVIFTIIAIVFFAFYSTIRHDQYNEEHLDERILNAKNDLANHRITVLEYCDIVTTDEQCVIYKNLHGLK